MMSKAVGIKWALLALVLAVLVVCSERHVTVVNGQVPGDAAKAFVDKMENYVMAIAANAEANYNGCQGLNQCVGTACSIAVCHVPFKSAKSLNWTCHVVSENENFDMYCSRPACRNMLKLDYSQSFVTLPDQGNFNLRPEVAKDICLQKPLDEGVFKHISTPDSDYIDVYFGTVSGAFRSYPGKEENKSFCDFFDARRRPWYLNGISVKKDVKILIDVSLSMGDYVDRSYNPDPGTTYLKVAQNITRNALLQTFSSQDFVEVFKFDSSSATSLTDSPVHINSSFLSLIREGPDRPELRTLIDYVNGLEISVDSGASNLTNALNKVLDSTSSFRRSNYSTVIIVLTNGNFAPVDASYFPTTRLVSSQTKLMIYKLDTGAPDKFLQATSYLETAVCSVNGSFEVLEANSVANPLYAMRSYFTFLAKTQLVAAENKPTWSPPYDSSTQHVKMTTVTYPAFGIDGQLIGVAGVDAIVGDQENVTDVLRNRKEGYLSAPSNIPLSCSYQKKEAVVQCQNQAGVDAICQPGVDNKFQSLQDITCCGSCSAKRDLSTGAKAGIGIGASIGGLLLIALVVLASRICRRQVRPWERRTPHPPSINSFPVRNVESPRNGNGDPP